MHVCHDPPRHARARQPFQRARQMRVAGMGIQPQGIADKDLGALDQGPGGVGDVRNVGQIDQAADAKAKRVDLAMGDAEGMEDDGAAGAVDRDRPLDPVQFADRGIIAAFGRQKDIGKAIEQCLRGRLSGPDRHPAAGIVDQLTDIIDTMDMIGMGMGIDHRFQCAHIGIQQLRHHVRAGVDQHACRALGPVPFHQQRTAAAAGLRVRRIAGPPAAAQPRHAPRRAATKDRGANHGWPPTRCPYPCRRCATGGGGPRQYFLSKSLEL